MQTNRLLAVAALAALPPSLTAQLTWYKAADQPAARAGHLAFFDSARGRVAVFGGDSPTGRAADCWQFDNGWVQMAMPAATPRGYGAACEDPLVFGAGLVFGGTDATGTLVSGTLRWNRELHQFDTLAPVTEPPLRWITAMAMDSSRQRAVLFGGGDSIGALGDTWEWNGSNWQLRSPSVAPAARGNHCMAYDAARGRVLLFGGHNGASLDDTWSWDGNTWTDVSGTFRPQPIHNAMMAFDQSRGCVVLFGGKNDLGIRNNVYWEWYGNGWTGPMQPTVSPAARELGTLTYDSRRRALILVGGVDQSGALLDDVWQLATNGWTQLSPLPVGSGPGVERSNHAAAFAANRGRMVVFGGNNQNTTAVYNDTAETNGSAWVNRAPSPAPTGRTGARMAYDSTHGNVLMFGGRGISTFTDNLVWTWTGTSWSSTSGGASPPLGRSGHALAWDVNRARLVLFGGVNTFGGTNETWEFVPGTGWSQRSPIQSPPARSGHAMAYHGGNGLTFIFGGTIWNGFPTDELWSWNGTTWTNVPSAARPPRLTDSAMCYDAARNRLVLFGGIDGHFTNDQVYEYDGITWQQLPALSSARPWGRQGASLVYDGRTQRCVLHGGNSGLTYFNDVWEWDGAAQTWTQRLHAGVPEPRAEHTLSYDPVRASTVLFGGTDGTRTFDDTWEWNGTAWNPKVTVFGPPPRHSAMTAFEQGTSKTVLYGGAASNGFVASDTWLYDGSSWSQALVGGPSPRFNHAMVSLAPQNGVLLFGGYDPSITQLGDTWLWNGASWVALANGPAVRDIHAMAYDQIRGRVVLFGGRSQNGVARSDTWEFVLATSSWVQRAPAQSPPARWNHAMTFDAGRGRVVMTGGHNGGNGFDDLWEWDGANWLQRSPETSQPAAAWNSALTYDRGRGRCIAFGGDMATGQSNELWELSAPIDLAGRGNTANPAAMRYYSQPTLGQPLRLGTSLPMGLGFYLLGFGPVQQPLFQIGGPPLCEPSNVFASLLNFLVLGNSEPNFAWSVPNTPLIVGVTLVFQAVSMQPGSCFRASDALQVQFR